MSAVDDFASNAEGLSTPVNDAAAVTPHDTNELTNVTRAVYVGGAGDLEVVMAGNDATVIFVGVPAGTFLPIRVKIIKAENTSATDILALW